MDARRRKIFKLIGAALAAPFAAAAAAREPDAVTVYLVKAELKCTATQAALVEDVLRSLGKAWGVGKFPADWKVGKKIIGAWEE